MSDCVYHAWMKHIVHYGQVPGMLPWEMYRLFRKGTSNEKGFTYGGLVPILIRMLSGMYGYSVRIQYRLWTPEMYIADVANGNSGIDVDQECKVLNLIGDTVNEHAFGEEVDKITLEPAIYLLLNQKHAVFSETVPKGGPVMALQVYK